MNVGSLFSGDGLLDYGLTLAGWEHRFFCESEADRREILRLRWPGVPIFEDVRDVDGAAPRVDLLAGGFPCRGASTAGLRTGLDHPETALWREFARIIRDLRPRLVLVENVANLLAVRSGAAWGTVLGDLAALGYVCAWDCLPAAAFGAPHLRDRVFCVAAPPACEGEQRNGGQREEQNGRADVGRGGADAPDSQRNGVRQQPVAERGGGGEAVAARADEDAADAASRAGRADGAGVSGEGQRSVPCEAGGRRARGLGGGGREDSWGAYAPAIARWEEAHGPAPEPLIRGLDARDARRLVRQQLSAYGDGVHLAPATYLGTRLLELARGLSGE